MTTDHTDQITRNSSTDTPTSDRPTLRRRASSWAPQTNIWLIKLAEQASSRACGHISAAQPSSPLSNSSNISSAPCRYTITSAQIWPTSSPAAGASISHTDHDDHHQRQNDTLLVVLRKGEPDQAHGFADPDDLIKLDMDVMVDTLLDWEESRGRKQYFIDVPRISTSPSDLGSALTVGIPSNPFCYLLGHQHEIQVGSTSTAHSDPTMNGGSRYYQNGHVENDTDEGVDNEEENEPDFEAIGRCGSVRWTLRRRQDQNQRDSESAEDQDQWDLILSVPGRSASQAEAMADIA